jgi:hypothetical protein
MMATTGTTSRRTWQNVKSKRRLQRIQNGQEGKRQQKKDTSHFKLPYLCGKNLLAPSCFLFVPSVFGERFPTAEF